MLRPCGDPLSLSTTELLVRGVAFGFSIAAPVGPIGVLCVQRTLSGGRRAGFVSGLGAASADAVYGAVVGFGITALSAVLIDAAAIRVGGGLPLLLIGVRAFRTAPSETAEADDVVDDRRGLVGDYASTLLLTLANPVTIPAFVGVFAGSAFWWLCLAAVVDRFRARLTPSHLRRVNQLAGVTIAGLGLLALWSAG